MATLTSSSTFDEVLAAYDDNASYAEDDDAAKAAAFITACRFLLRYPKRTAHGGRGEEIELSPETIRAEKADAERWLAHKNAASESVTHYSSFENFR